MALKGRKHGTAVVRGNSRGEKSLRVQGTNALGRFVMIHERKTHWTSLEAGDKQWYHV